MRTLLELLRAERAGDPLTVDEVEYLNAHRKDPWYALLDAARRELGDEAFKAAYVAAVTTPVKPSATELAELDRLMEAELSSQMAEVLHRADGALAEASVLTDPSGEAAVIGRLSHLVRDLCSVIRRRVAVDGWYAAGRAVASGQQRRDRKKGRPRAAANQNAAGQALIDTIKRIKARTPGMTDRLAAIECLKADDPVAWDRGGPVERKRLTKNLLDRLRTARAKNSGG